MATRTDPAGDHAPLFEQIDETRLALAEAGSALRAIEDALASDDAVDREQLVHTERALLAALGNVRQLKARCPR